MQNHILNFNQQLWMGERGGGVYFINDMYYWRRIFVRMAPFQSECLNNFATSCRTNKSKVFGGYVVMLAKITDIPQSWRYYLMNL